MLSGHSPCTCSLSKWPAIQSDTDRPADAPTFDCHNSSLLVFSFPSLFQRSLLCTSSSTGHCSIAGNNPLQGWTCGQGQGHAWLDGVCSLQIPSPQFSSLRDPPNSLSMPRWDQSGSQSMPVEPGKLPDTTDHILHSYHPCRGGVACPYQCPGSWRQSTFNTSTSTILT